MRGWDTCRWAVVKKETLLGLPLLEEMVVWICRPTVHAVAPTSGATGRTSCASGDLPLHGTHDMQAARALIRSTTHLLTADLTPITL